jgi:hypothetical protein
MEHKILNYNTPITDAILLNNGWVRFENTPVYVKKFKDYYMTSFHVDFKNYHGRVENDMQRDHWKNMDNHTIYEYLGYGHITSNAISKESPRVELLYMLAADAYHQNAVLENEPNFDLHNTYVKKYEILSGSNYKTEKDGTK